MFDSAILLPDIHRRFEFYYKGNKTTPQTKNHKASAEFFYTSDNLLGPLHMPYIFSDNLLLLRLRYEMNICYYGQCTPHLHNQRSNYCLSRVIVVSASVLGTGNKTVLVVREFTVWWGRNGRQATKR